MKNFGKMALVLGALLVGIVSAQGQGMAPNLETLRVEISEDMTRFAFDESKTFEDGLPAHGSGFVTVGYVYPAGTLNGSNGVREDGSPEFPDKVLGEWTCYGWMVGDGMHTMTGPIVATTQIFRLDEGYAGATIVTDGFELADINLPVERVVTGGTGQLQNATGKQVQVLTGMTEYMGVNLRVEFHLQ